MRYSLRTILVCVLFFSLVFGGYLQYDRIWRTHCKNLEPSLFAFVLQRQIDAERKMAGSLGRDISNVKLHLSLGFNQESGEWVWPSDQLIEDIGVAGVVSVDGIGKVGASNVVWYIENVRWFDWDAVTLEFGWDGGPQHGAERRGGEFLHVNGNWQINNEPILRVEPTRDRGKIM